MESIIETFHVDWQLIIAQLINFAVVVFVLWFFALKPLVKVMQERTQKIEQSLEDAKKAVKRLEQADSEKSTIIKEARKQAEQIIGQAKVLAEDKTQQALNFAKEQVAKIVAESKAQLHLEKQKMVAEAKNELAQTVVLATRQILADVADKKVDQTLQQRAIEVLKLKK